MEYTNAYLVNRVTTLEAMLNRVKEVIELVGVDDDIKIPMIKGTLNPYGVTKQVPNKNEA